MALPARKTKWTIKVPHSNVPEHHRHKNYLALKTVHFWVPIILTFETSRSAKPFLWKWIIKKHFHINGFALSLVLKQRLRVTRKFRAKKRSAQASAHPLSQAQGGLFCVLTVFVCCWSAEWNARHEVRTFAPCKAFLLEMFAFFSSLENYFGFRTTNVKGKRIILSIWGGIKGFEHFLRGEYFSDCASD